MQYFAGLTAELITIVIEYQKRTNGTRGNPHTGRLQKFSRKKMHRTS
jgi:hypothetical protein